MGVLLARRIAGAVPLMLLAVVSVIPLAGIASGLDYSRKRPAYPVISR